jgi:hypothetical protein
MKALKKAGKSLYPLLISQTKMESRTLVGKTVMEMSKIQKQENSIASTLIMVGTDSGRPNYITMASRLKWTQQNYIRSYYSKRHDVGQNLSSMYISVEP